MSRVYLPPESEEALLKSLLAPGSDIAKFKTICDLSPELFGTPGSALRRQVQKRRSYLQRYPASNFASSLYYAGKPAVSPTVPSPPKSSATTSSSDKTYLSPPPRKLLSPTTNSGCRTQSSSIMTSRRHQGNAVLKAGESELPIVDLYTDDWWENPEGMILTVVPEVDVDNTLVTKLEIKKAIFDIRDMSDDNKLYKARLASDGTGIIVTEPVQVGWMWKEPRLIQELMDGGPKKACARTLKKFKAYCVDYKKSKEKQSKEVFYRFADGFTVNNNFFNKVNKSSRSTLDLVTELRIVQITVPLEPKNVVQCCPMLFWRVAIDGDDRTHEEESDGIANLVSAFGHVGIQGTNDEEEDDEENDNGDYF